ncbi:DNA-binding protein [Thomasclavelia spiroformis]|uniref:DNA-binding protein n=1 Tax=Thomasclavelia spiroformis TaxID=29348 RepID=UPI0024B1464E|nr:DNA-binding protein [Thomasclavelia spiroformis]
MAKNNSFLDAHDIVELTGMSEAYAYKLIKQLNEELQGKGFITIRGRVSKQYFEERIYGLRKDDENASL